MSGGDRCDGASGRGSGSKDDRNVISSGSGRDGGGGGCCSRGWLW